MVTTYTPLKNCALVASRNLGLMWSLKIFLKQQNLTKLIWLLVSSVRNINLCWLFFLGAVQENVFLNVILLHVYYIQRNKARSEYQLHT